MMVEVLARSCTIMFLPWKRMRSRWHQTSFVLRLHMVLLLLPLLLGTSNAAANKMVDADYRACLEALQQSDLDHDLMLNRYPEYVTYLHLLSPPPTSIVMASRHHQNRHYDFREAAVIGDNFDVLPRPLQDAFEAFADSPTTINGQQVVNISQAFLPLDNYDDEHNVDSSNNRRLLGGKQTLFLMEFCQQTRQALFVGMPLTTTRRKVQDDDHLGAAAKGMVGDDHSAAEMIRRSTVHSNNHRRWQKEELDGASPSLLPTTITTTMSPRRLRGATVGDAVVGMVESNQITRPGDVVGGLGDGAATMIPIDSSEAEGCGSGNDHIDTTGSSSSPCSLSSYLRSPNNAKNDVIRLLQSATMNNHGGEGLASESMPNMPLSKRHESVGEEDDSQRYQLYNILPPHVTTPPRHLSEEDDCSIWVRFSDLDRDGSLSKGDFVILVNLMAGQTMGTDFTNLPDSLQATFSRLASTTTSTTNADSEEGISFSNEATDDATNRWLNIFENNNNDPTAAADANDHSAQIVPIKTICSETRTALDAILSQDGAGDMDATIANKEIAVPACSTKNAAIYDKDRDGKLTFDEFTRFSNGLRTGEATSASLFQDLPQDVQDIFMQQAIKEFNPFGAKTEIDTIPLAEKLNGGQLLVSFGKICTHADEIITALNNHTPLEEPSHSSSSTTSTTHQEMTSKSKSSYRTELDLKDFSQYNNSSHSVPAISSMVPQVLAQANSTTPPGPTTIPGPTTNATASPTIPPTAANTAAPITPAATTAAPNNTTQAATQAPNTNATQATTQAPTTNTTSDFTDPNATEAPTGPQVVTGYNSWIMGNPLQLKAADLKASPDYAEIKRAYASYSSSVVDDMIADRAPRRLLRRRRLEVKLESESARVYEVIDSLCPANLLVQDEINCVTVFGRVNIIATNESTRNVYNEYVSASQLGIEGGLLQDTLAKQSPGLFWFVDGAAKLVQPTADFPVPPVPEEEKDWRGGTDLMTGLAISGLIAIVCVLFVCLFVLVPAARAKRVSDDKKQAALFALREAEAMKRAEAAAEAAAADAALASLAERLKNSAGKKKKLGPCPGAEHDESENPYRAEVERLLTENCPDRLDELDSLLWQFKGREEELIDILKRTKDNESVLDEDSEVELEWDSDSLSSGVSVPDTAPDDVSMPDVQEDEPEPEVIEVADDDSDEFESDSSSTTTEPEPDGGLEPPDQVEDKPLEPPDDESIEDKQLEPPDDESVEQLEPPDDESFSSENPASDSSIESEPSIKEESSSTSSEPPPPPPEPVKPHKEMDSMTMDMDDSEDWDSDSTKGYKIRWFQENGCWKCEKVWPEDGSDSSDYDSSDSSDDEQQQDWEWVNNGRGWTKEPIDKETQNKEALASDDDDDSYYISSDSDSEEGPAAKWGRENGQWKQIG